MKLLGQLLEETCASNPRFVFVSGEPGIGKTSLLLELFRQAERRGCLALGGSAAEFEPELPFGLVVDALDEYLESLDPGDFNRLSSEDLGELAGVFPALSSVNPGIDQPTTAAEPRSRPVTWMSYRRSSSWSVPPISDDEIAVVAEASAVAAVLVVSGLAVSTKAHTTPASSKPGALARCWKPSEVVMSACSGARAPAWTSSS